MGQPVDAPDAQRTQNILDATVTGPMYEPQNAAERIAHAGGAAIGANPPLAAMTGLAGTFGAGAASEGAHEVFKGTSLDTPSQIIAPLLLGKLGKSNLAKEPKGVSQDALLSTADDQFKALHQSDIELHPSAMQNWALPTKAALEARGLDADTAPVTNKVLDKFTSAAAGDPITANDIIKTRSKLSELSGQKDGVGMPTSEAKAAGDALESYHDLLLTPGNVPQGAVLNGDLGAFRSGLSDAVNNWRAGKNMARWDGAISDAANSAAVANSGANVGQYMRQAGKKFINGAAKSARGMTDDETQAIQSFMAGSYPNNALGTVSTMLGGGRGALAALEGTAGLLHGNPALMATPLAGMALRGLYNRNVANQASDISDMLSRRSPLADQLGLSGMPPSLWPGRIANLSQRVARAAQGPEAVWATGQ